MKLLIILSLFVSINAFGKTEVKKEHKHPLHGQAGHNHATDHAMNADLKSANKKEAVIKVQGMVCAFCAQGIEKNFNKRDEVKSTDVNLDKMEVHVKYKDGKSLSEAEIKKIVTGAGFKFKGIQDVK